MIFIPKGYGFYPEVIIPFFLFLRVIFLKFFYSESFYSDGLLSKIWNIKPLNNYLLDNDLSE